MCPFRDSVAPDIIQVNVIAKSKYRPSNLVGSGGRGNKVCEDPANLPEPHLGRGLLHDLIVGVGEDLQGVLAALLGRLVDRAHHSLDAQRHVMVLLIPVV